MMCQPTLPLLLIGDIARPELRAALGGEHALAAGWRVAADVNSAAATIGAEGFVPEVIVLAQAYSGQFSHAAVERLRRLCPLARLIGLLGTWCEGEARSGHPWPGVTRVLWHQWPWRGPRQLAALASGEPTPLLLPPTATAEEAVLAETQPIPLSRLGEGPGVRAVGAASGSLPQERIAIVSRNRAMANMLVAACRAWGLVGWVERCETHAAFFPRLQYSVHHVNAALFDCAELDVSATGELVAFIRATATTHVAVLANFPRLDDVLRALAAGAAAVFSKPVDLNDVHAWLDSVCTTA